MAARLCGAAGPGEILTVEATYEAAAQQRKLYEGRVPLPRLSFSSRGRMPFKNVDVPVEVIAVTRKE